MGTAERTGMPGGMAMAMAKYQHPHRLPIRHCHRLMLLYRRKRTDLRTAMPAETAMAVEMTTVMPVARATATVTLAGTGTGIPERLLAIPAAWAMGTRAAATMVMVVTK